MWEEIKNKINVLKYFTDNNITIFLWIYPLLFIFFTGYTLFNIISFFVLHFLFFYSFWKIILFHKKAEKIRFWVIIYFFLNFVLFYLWYNTAFFLYLAFLYWLLWIFYLSRIHLMWYFILRKLFYPIVKAFNSLFYRVYYIFTEVSIFLLLMSFFILILHSLSFIHFDNLTLNYFINSVNSSINYYLTLDKFYLYLNKLILLTLFLLIIKNIKSFYNLIYIIFFRWSTGVVVLVGFYLYIKIFYNSIFIEKSNDSQQIFSIVITSILSIYYLLFIIRKYEKIEFEWKNKLFKKFFKEKNIKQFEIILWIRETLNPNAQNYIENKVKLFFKELNSVLEDFRIYVETERDYITLIDDNPYSLWKTDLLWINEFSKNIAELVDWISFNNTLNKSFSIWIVWEWWLWKSSIINLLREKYLEWYPQYEIMHFNPWNFEKDKLIESFFNDLSITIWIKWVKPLIEQYLNLLWEFNSKLKILKIFNKKERIEDVKVKLNEKLRELNTKKIIVIIDDLDRCFPNEVIVVLNIIKNLWDLSNIIYVVSYDKNNIIHILKKEWYGQNYLDKIINIEKHLTLFSKEKLKCYFKSELEYILKYMFNVEDREAKISKAVVDISLINVDLSWFWLVHFIKEVFSKVKQAFLKKSIENVPTWIISNSRSLDEYSDYLVNKFDYILENENLRFIKKFLNQINIILKVNFNTFPDIEIVKNFTKEDYYNIFLINYVKIKDYEWFGEIMNLRFNNFIENSSSRQELDIDEENLPEYLKSFYNKQESILKIRFISLFFNIYETTRSERDDDTQNSYTIYTTWLNFTPKEINWNLKLILEKFN